MPGRSSFLTASPAPLECFAQTPGNLPGPPSHRVKLDRCCGETGLCSEHASERSEASHAPAFAPKALRRGLAVAFAKAETERAGAAASERACRGVRGAEP